ncbi:hypothetical protein [Pelolinea submarina]|uniref:Helicase XPB/Ssl2 N-terminal domain-containing protein n=1 Tax=Pelolinea submarina TaxID=913107 RepID=A0A347ZVT2_9CHLR|nr:hypothetical protein [Pelolinea submarina]REG07109.1 hypothetical protein DFR64_2313 [Pelolinea submarina]BBB49413.1 hypothetical protein Pelsub_P2644 [Pelolinea submarina]
MPTLIESIIDYEPDQLDMLAEQWGIQQELDPAKSAARQIAARLQDRELFDEVLQALPDKAYQALLRLARSGGRQPLDQFQRVFGELREMGAARREKVRPDRNPGSITEKLYYSGFIARAFLREGGQPQEFIYLPEEFQQFMSAEIERLESDNIPALPNYTPARVYTASDIILEHACTLLAGLRKGLAPEQIALVNPQVPVDFLQTLLSEAGLLNGGKPDPERIGAFLEAPHARSFSTLNQVWQHSTAVNETKLLQHLAFEGTLKINTLQLRQRLLALFAPLPAGQWFDLDEFSGWIKQRQPDFLRSAGDYDSWIIQHKEKGFYLKGFEHWDEVEGELLKAALTGPFFWLGLVDLGTRSKSGKAQLFRRSAWTEALLEGQTLEYAPAEVDSFALNKDGGLLVERGFPLSLRYQLARFCDWGLEKKGKYSYRISPPALQEALRQGLQVNQLIVLINKHARKPLPPNIPQALERWKQHELEAVFEQPVLLRVRSAVILDQLLATRSGNTLTRLNDTTAVVKSGSVQALKEALLDMGILADVRLEV